MIYESAILNGVNKLTVPILSFLEAFLWSTPFSPHYPEMVFRPNFLLVSESAVHSSVLGQLV